MTFQDELAALINKHSEENESNTPDFVLAGYLYDCLEAFNRATRDRSQWYGMADGIPATSPIAKASLDTPDSPLNR